MEQLRRASKARVHVSAFHLFIYLFVCVFSFWSILVSLAQASMRRRRGRKCKCERKCWLLLPLCTPGLLSEMRVFGVGAVPATRLPSTARLPAGEREHLATERRRDRCVFRVDWVLKNHRESQIRRRKWRMLTEDRERETELGGSVVGGLSAGSVSKTLPSKQSAIINVCVCVCIYIYARILTVNCIFLAVCHQQAAFLSSPAAFWCIGKNSVG